MHPCQPCTALTPDGWHPPHASRSAACVRNARPDAWSEAQAERPWPNGVATARLPHTDAASSAAPSRPARLETQCAASAQPQAPHGQRNAGESSLRPAGLETATSGALATQNGSAYAAAALVDRELLQARSEGEASSSDGSILSPSSSSPGHSSRSRSVHTISSSSRYASSSDESADARPAPGSREQTHEPVCEPRPPGLDTLTSSEVLGTHVPPSGPVPGPPQHARLRHSPSSSAAAHATTQAGMPIHRTGARLECCGAGAGFSVFMCCLHPKILAVIVVQVSLDLQELRRRRCTSRWALLLLQLWLREKQTSHSGKALLSPHHGMLQ